MSKERSARPCEVRAGEEAPAHLPDWDDDPETLEVIDSVSVMDVLAYYDKLTDFTPYDESNGCVGPSLFGASPDLWFRVIPHGTKSQTWIDDALPDERNLFGDVVELVMALESCDKRTALDLLRKLTVKGVCTSVRRAVEGALCD